MIIDHIIKNDANISDSEMTAEEIEEMFDKKISELRSDRVHEFRRESYYIIKSILSSNWLITVGIKGIRAVGKTTILKQLCKDMDGALYFDIALLKGKNFTVGAVITAVNRLIDKYNAKIVCMDEINILDLYINEARNIIEMLQSSGIKTVATASASVYMDRLEYECGTVRIQIVTVGEMSFQEYMRFKGYGWNRYKIGYSVEGLSEYKHDYNDLYIDYALGCKYPVINGSRKEVKVNYTETIVRNIRNTISMSLMYSLKYGYKELKNMGFSSLLDYMVQILYMLACKGIETYTVDKLRMLETYEYSREIRGIAENKLQNPGVNRMSEIDKQLKDAEGENLKSISVQKAVSIIQNIVNNKLDKLEVYKQSKSIRFESEYRLKLALALLYEMGLVFVEYKSDNIEKSADDIDTMHVLEMLKDEKCRYADIEKNWNFVLLNTSLYGYIIEDFLGTLGEGSNIEKVCRGMLRGVIVETSLKSDYVRYMRYPVVTKYNASESVQHLENVVTREIEKTRREIEAIEMTSNNKNITDDGKRQVASRIAYLEARLRKLESKNISDRPDIKSTIEIDMIDNVCEPHMACEISSRNKSYSEVNLDKFKSGIKILTTYNIDDTLNKDFDASSIIRVPFGKAGLYFSSKALARLAIDCGVTYWMR